MLLDSLDGGGTKALRIDAQGKTFAAALLNQSIKIGFGLLVLITVFGGILLWDSFYNI